MFVTSGCEGEVRKSRNGVPRAEQARDPGGHTEFQLDAPDRQRGQGGTRDHAQRSLRIDRRDAPKSRACGGAVRRIRNKASLRSAMPVGAPQDVARSGSSRKFQAICDFAFSNDAGPALADGAANLRAMLRNACAGAG